MGFPKVRMSKLEELLFLSNNSEDSPQSEALQIYREGLRADLKAMINPLTNTVIIPLEVEIDY